MKCFLCVPSDIHEVSISTSWSGCSKNPYGGDGKHDAETIFFTGPKTEAQEAFNQARGTVFHAMCRFCGADGGDRMTDTIGSGVIWRREDTGEVRRFVHTFGPGAMYFATWYRHGDNSGLYGWDWDNLLSPPLLVVTPSGREWNIDSRASNCTMTNDRQHRCWVRHGDPPNVTVDKNGVTCGAGAGSIVSGDYHGFLRNGEFTPTC